VLAQIFDYLHIFTYIAIMVHKYDRPGVEPVVGQDFLEQIWVHAKGFWIDVDKFDFVSQKLGCIGPCKESIGREQDCGHMMQPKGTQSHQEGRGATCCR